MLLNSDLCVRALLSLLSLPAVLEIIRNSPLEEEEEERDEGEEEGKMTF